MSFPYYNESTFPNICYQSNTSDLDSLVYLAVSDLNSGLSIPALKWPIWVSFMNFCISSLLQGVLQNSNSLFISSSTWSATLSVALATKGIIVLNTSPGTATCPLVFPPSLFRHKKKLGMVQTPNLFQPVVY